MRGLSTALGCIGLLLLPGIGAAETPPATQAQSGAASPRVSEAVAAVQAQELRATVTRLVGFGTRHTLSDSRSPTRGIGAARRWVQSRFETIGRECGGCLEVVMPSETVTGPRIPAPTEVVNVVAIQRGTGDPNRLVIITGHLDSRVSDVANATADAPGANDDASGVAAVMEAARVLSRHRFRATIVYAALSGEEQGLNGGAILARYARERGWRVVANLNNDIIGNTTGTDGARDDRTVRVFSEGTRTLETPAEASRRRYNGGEVDSPSRNLARYMDDIAEHYVPGLDVVMVYRTDRYGRGGDQVRMLEAGFPAVRVTEARENYDRQHQDLRTENGRVYGDTLDGVDFDYLARVTRLNVATLAALASAPAPPSGVDIAGAVSSDTTVTWTPAPDAVRYRIWWRSTTDPQWRMNREVEPSGRAVLHGVIIDDWFFGVQAIGPDGAASPIVFPGAAGAFWPAPVQTGVGQ